MSTLETEILRLYDAFENPIHPFIGQAFEGANRGALRVMTIGINAYLSPKDWPNQQPTWFSSWFKEGRHPFDRGVAEGAGTIANSLTANSTLYSALAFRGTDSIFHTNAVKSYLPESSGKTSDQISPRDYHHRRGRQRPAAAGRQPSAYRTLTVSHCNSNWRNHSMTDERTVAPTEDPVCGMTWTQPKLGRRA